MTVRCAAYLGMSLDGFIAGPNDELDWLEGVEAIAGEDFGFGAFMTSVDALVMGRRTFEAVLGFDIPWPYAKPILVMSSSLQQIPERATDSELFAGDPAAAIAEAADRGWTKLYIDGGRLVSSFINEGLLDELVVSVLPVALGTGIPVFGALEKLTWFSHVSTTTFDNGMVQTTYTLA